MSIRSTLCTCAAIAVAALTSLAPFASAQSTNPSTRPSSTTPPATRPTTVPALIPDEWTDATTGRRVVRLSRMPGSSDTLYFHQNIYTASGDKMVFVNTPPGGEQQVCTYDFKTSAIETLAPCAGDYGTTGLNVAPKSRIAYFRVKGTVYASNIDTKATRVVATVPDLWAAGNGFALSPDEKTLVGCYAEEANPPIVRYEPKAKWMEDVFNAHLPNHIYAIDIATGATRILYSENNWLGHVQFSPVDSNVLMYCREGPWTKVDRIWTVRMDSLSTQLMYARTKPLEVAGHEFWDPTGKLIWFDVQQNGTTDKWLASADINGKPVARYPLLPEESSIHFNISHDGKLFAGDGNEKVRPDRPTGKWIYLFTPQTDGTVKVEKLCDMAAHDYKLEPNVRFSPDNKWVIFRSNMHGIDQVYAVEVEKSRS